MPGSNWPAGLGGLLSLGSQRDFVDFVSRTDKVVVEFVQTKGHVEGNPEPLKGRKVSTGGPAVSSTIAQVCSELLA